MTPGPYSGDKPADEMAPPFDPRRYGVLLHPPAPDGLEPSDELALIRCTVQLTYNTPRGLFQLGVPVSPELLDDPNMWRELVDNLARLAADSYAAQP